MLTAPMTPMLLRMTGPMILGIIAILAFNLVDTFFIGMLGTQALAAISFTFPVTFVVTSLTMGLGAGLCALLGHALGQGRHDEAARITTDCLCLAVILVSLLAGLGALTITPLFTLLGASPELISLIHDYMLIWYLTVPMLVVPMVGNAAIRTTGDTKTPSLVMGVAGLVNGVLDPLLIFGPGPFPEWGIRGAAIATSLSWLMAMLVSLYILRHREGLLRWRLSPRPQLLAHWRALLHVAVPASFTNMLNPLANAVLMIIFAGLGTEVVAAYGAASRVEALLLIVMMALSSVLAPFISQNCGAGNPARAKAALLLCMRFALIFQLGVYVLTWLLAPFIADLFSDHPQVVRLIVLYLHLVPIGYGFQGMVMLLASALNGVRASAVSLLINGVRLFVFLLPGPGWGQNWGENRGSIWGCCWRTWPPDCWHGGMPATDSSGCAIRGDPDGTARGSRLLFAFELPFDDVATPSRGLSGPVIARAWFKRLLASLEAPHLHPELIAANQLVGQHVAQPGLQQQDADNIAHKSRDNQQQARQRQHHATHHLAAGHLPQLHLLLGSEQGLDPLAAHQRRSQHGGQHQQANGRQGPDHGAHFDHDGELQQYQPDQQQ